MCHKETLINKNHRLNKKRTNYQLRGIFFIGESKSLKITVGR